MFMHICIYTVAIQAILQVDAYVLSESSMFVSKRRFVTHSLPPVIHIYIFTPSRTYLQQTRFILKTCGTTTPLDCIEQLTRLNILHSGIHTYWRLDEGPQIERKSMVFDHRGAGVSQNQILIDILRIVWTLNYSIHDLWGICIFYIILIIYCMGMVYGTHRQNTDMAGIGAVFKLDSNTFSSVFSWIKSILNYYQPIWLQKYCRIGEP